VSSQETFIIPLAIPFLPIYCLEEPTSVFTLTFTFTFTFRAFGRRFYPKRLTKSKFVERDSNISLWSIENGRIEQVSSIHNLLG